jgi:hypothetical protein
MENSNSPDYRILNLNKGNIAKYQGRYSENKKFDKISTKINKLKLDKASPALNKQEMIRIGKKVSGFWETCGARWTLFFSSKSSTSNRRKNAEKVLFEHAVAAIRTLNDKTIAGIDQVGKVNIPVFPHTTKSALPILLAATKPQGVMGYQILGDLAGQFDPSTTQQFLFIHNLQNSNNQENQLYKNSAPIQAILEKIPAEASPEKIAAMLLGKDKTEALITAGVLKEAHAPNTYFSEPEKALLSMGQAANYKNNYNQQQKQISDAVNALINAPNSIINKQDIKTAITTKLNELITKHANSADPNRWQTITKEINDFIDNKINSKIEENKAAFETAYNQAKEEFERQMGEDSIIHDQKDRILDQLQTLFNDYTEIANNTYADHLEKLATIKQIITAQINTAIETKIAENKAAFAADFNVIDQKRQKTTYQTVKAPNSQMSEFNKAKLTFTRTLNQNYEEYLKQEGNDFADYQNKISELNGMLDDFINREKDKALKFQEDLSESDIYEDRPIEKIIHPVEPLSVVEPPKQEVPIVAANPPEPVTKEPIIKDEPQIFVAEEVFDQPEPLGAKEELKKEEPKPIPTDLGNSDPSQIPATMPSSIAAQHLSNPLPDPEIADFVEVPKQPQAVKAELTAEQKAQQQETAAAVIQGAKSVATSAAKRILPNLDNRLIETSLSEMFPENPVQQIEATSKLHRQVTKVHNLPIPIPELGKVVSILTAGAYFTDERTEQAYQVANILLEKDLIKHNGNTWVIEQVKLQKFNAAAAKKKSHQLSEVEINPAIVILNELSSAATELKTPQLDQLYAKYLEIIKKGINLGLRLSENDQGEIIYRKAKDSNSKDFAKFQTENEASLESILPLLNADMSEDNQGPSFVNAVQILFYQRKASNFGRLKRIGAKAALNTVLGREQTYAQVLPELASELNLNVNKPGSKENFVKAVVVQGLDIFKGTICKAIDFVDIFENTFDPNNKKPIDHKKLCQGVVGIMVEGFAAVRSKGLVADYQELSTIFTDNEAGLAALE